MEDLIWPEVIVSGRAQGIALVSPDPLSFWGGYDPLTGEITDRRHPLSGKNAAGRVLIMPFTRGSSTGTQILLESIRLGRSPAAIISSRTDSFLALASVIASELYGIRIPILATGLENFTRFKTGQQIIVNTDGTIKIIA